MTAPRVQQIRSQFPALAREVNGHPAAYLDGPAGSQVPQPVLDAVLDYLANRNANTHGAFATSVDTDEVIRTARERMAALFGSPAAESVVFGANMTTLTFSLSRALRHAWGPGDEVIVTELDHQANVAPWKLAAEEAGATVRMVPFDPERCTLDMDALRGMLSPRTRLVAVGYASNALGTVNDVAEVARLAREVGAISFVDAVHFAPHGVMDVQAVGCDFLICSAYKFFGPHVGVLWGRPEVLADFRPFKLPPQLDSAPERWETGTLNHEGIAGTAAAVEWIASLGEAGEGAPWRERVVAGMEVIEQIERPLFQRLLTGLGEIAGVRVYGAPAGAPRTPTVAFTVQGVAPRRVAEELAGEGVFVWDGDFYAASVIDRLGLRASGGLVRVGLAPYNTEQEIDRLLLGVRRMAGR